MTEEEWKVCPFGNSLIRQVRAFNNARKLRLLGVACCRILWPQLTDQRSKAAVEVAERFADQQAGSEEMWAAKSQAEWAWAGIRDESSIWGWRFWAAKVVLVVADDGRDWEGWTPWILADTVLQYIVKKHLWSDDREAMSVEEIQASMAQFARIVREIIPTPTGILPPIPNDWLTPTITNLAQTIYVERQLPSGLFDNQRLTVLADALEEAGCDNADILGHLRGGGDHVRGCWAVDLVLGKE
jgi:hypothetical protein